MAIIAHNEADVDLLARLMRAEAEGDGDLEVIQVDSKLIVFMHHLQRNALKYIGRERYK